MDNDVSTELFKAIMKIQAQLEQMRDLMATKDDTDRILTTLDGWASRLDDDEVKRVALSRQTDRHEDLDR